MAVGSWTAQKKPKILAGSIQFIPPTSFLGSFSYCLWLVISIYNPQPPHI